MNFIGTSTSDDIYTHIFHFILDVEKSTVPWNSGLCEHPIIQPPVTRQMNMNFGWGEKSQRKPIVIGEKPVVWPLIRNRYDTDCTGNEPKAPQWEVDDYTPCMLMYVFRFLRNVTPESNKLWCTWQQRSGKVQPLYMKLLELSKPITVKKYALGRDQLSSGVLWSSV
jgi:hypothetical protein